MLFKENTRFPGLVRLILLFVAVNIELPPTAGTMDGK